MTQKFDLIIVGEGVAGLTCASEAAKAGLAVATFETEFFGGMAVNVNELDNFEPAEGESGMTYAALLAAGNKKAGVKSMPATVSAIKAVDDGFEVQADTDAYVAKFVVIASGTRWTELGLPGESEYEGRGISHCADCDAPLYSGGTAVVAGGGDWALKSALLLAQECETVHVVGALEACEDYLQRVKERANIRLYSDHSIQDIMGDDDGVTGVRVKSASGDETEITASGLFVMVGQEPNSAMAPAQVKRDEKNFLVVDDKLETGVSGLWAIGQVRSGFQGWLNDAVSDGRLAALQILARAS